MESTAASTSMETLFPAVSALTLTTTGPWFLALSTSTSSVSDGCDDVHGVLMMTLATSFFFSVVLKVNSTSKGSALGHWMFTIPRRCFSSVTILAVVPYLQSDGNVRYYWLIHRNQCLNLRYDDILIGIGNFRGSISDIVPVFQIARVHLDVQPPIILLHRLIRFRIERPHAGIRPPRHFVRLRRLQRPIREQLNVFHDIWNRIIIGILNRMIKNLNFIDFNQFKCPFVLSNELFECYFLGFVELFECRMKLLLSF